MCKYRFTLFYDKQLVVSRRRIDIFKSCIYILEADIIDSLMPLTALTDKQIGL